MSHTDYRCRRTRRVQALTHCERNTLALRLADSFDEEVYRQTAGFIQPSFQSPHGFEPEVPLAHLNGYFIKPLRHMLPVPFGLFGNREYPAAKAK